MSSVSARIERYLLQLLASGDGVVETRRSALAEMFGCVPSQINYVLETRFTPERGYMIESRRGEGGYIRIVRVNLEKEDQIRDLISRQIGTALSQERAEHHIERLLGEGLITPREGRLLGAAIQRDALRVGLPLRDLIRASVFRSMLLALLRD